MASFSSFNSILFEDRPHRATSAATSPSCMAFFSNSQLHDSQLRRKRSTSTTRDRPSRLSTDDKSDETSFHKRSSSVSASPFPSATTPEHNDPAPPLPTPVTAELGFHPRTAGTRNASPFSYDQSSTPIPFTKPTKRVSPSPSSNLIIDVQSPRSVESDRSPSPRAAVNHPDISRTAPASPSALYPIPNSSFVKHASATPEDLSSGLFSPSMSHAERQRPPFSQRIAAVLPLKLPHSPTRTRNSDIGSIALPTPVSPRQGQRTTQPEPIPIPPLSPPGRPHSRSQSATNSPTAYATESGPGSPKSSARRFPAPMVNLDIGEESGPGSPSASGKSTPSHEAAHSKPREKRARNVLRKRSITGGSRRHEPASAPASDNEKKTYTHRTRSRSVVFPSRRDSSGPMLDISHPLPTIPLTVTDLTPAKEILVAYKESQREGVSRDKPLRSLGKVVAVGSEEDSNTNSPTSLWTSALSSGHNHEGRAEDQDLGEKSGTGIRTLMRKLSGKRSGKELSRRRDDPTRSVSEGAVEVSGRKLTRNTEVNHSKTISNDTRPSASPASGRSPGRGRQVDHEESRVWEEDAGKWVGKNLRDNETEKDVSNSRRLWKLVKRLSSGNLREKGSPPLEPLPPVPPLPKNLSRNRDMRPREAHDFRADEMPIPQSAVPEAPGGIRRFITSVPSLSIPRSEADSGLPARQTSVHHHRSDLDSGEGKPSTSLRMKLTYRSVTAGTPIQMRRTATTRSSSPSSETTKFFSRSRSSSSSSYGDAMAPPMPRIPPPAHAGEHTLSPLEPHSNHNNNGEDTVAMERSAKSSTSSSPGTSDETSSTIPPFEALHPVNKFLSYRTHPPLSPTSHFPDDDPIIPCKHQAEPTNPPPIPKRNPRRPGHRSVSISPLPAHQLSNPNVIPVQDSDESEVADRDALRPKRRLDSEHTPSIPKPRPRSISDGAINLEPDLYKSTAKSTLAFREMTTMPRQLTEQEKNAKWEDLLQRSDKAGGTLHVGSPIVGGLGLWSDRSSVALSVVPSDSTD